MKVLWRIDEGKVYVRDWDNDRWDFPEEGRLIVPDDAIRLSHREATRLYVEAPPLPPM